VPSERHSIRHSYKAILVYSSRLFMPFKPSGLRATIDTPLLRLLLLFISRRASLVVLKITDNAKLIFALVTQYTSGVDVSLFGLSPTSIRFESLMALRFPVSGSPMVSLIGGLAYIKHISSIRMNKNLEHVKNVRPCGRAFARPSVRF